MTTAALTRSQIPQIGYAVSNRTTRSRPAERLAFTSTTSPGTRSPSAAIGSADDLGRAGRSLTRACSALAVEGRGPWPGSFYAWPLIAVVLIGLVVAGVALLSVTRRPRQGEDSVLDDALRRARCSPRPACHLWAFLLPAEAAAIRFWAALTLARGPQ